MNKEGSFISNFGLLICKKINIFILEEKIYEDDRMKPRERHKSFCTTVAPKLSTKFDFTKLDKSGFNCFISENEGNLINIIFKFKLRSNKIN